MASREDLQNLLTRIDKKGYKAYKELEGSFDFETFQLHMDYVQPDPFAVPSRVRVTVGLSKAGFPPSLFDRRIKRIALQDFIARKFDSTIKKVSKGRRGIGRGGLISIDCGQQEILERNAVSIDAQGIEIRFTLGLPAEGRRILGKEASEIFFQELPQNPSSL
jgi:predicted ABC-class ATPase